MDVNKLQEWIEGAFDTCRVRTGEFDDWFGPFIVGLTQGTIRAAEPLPDGGWKVNTWVKKGILLGFRLGVVVDRSANDTFSFFDKDTYPLRPMSLEEGIRVVPGGTSVRTGSHLAPGVVIMPPAYVNVGAFVGPSTMIDSHALVGSCAQIGARVHLSAAAQIGGVLEPIGALPVIVEDDVMIGGNCGIYEGIRIGRRAVIGAGTVLTRSVPVYDLVREQVLRSTAGQPVEIPEGAVVVPGTRRLDRGGFASAHGLSAACALIIKYRDERTDAATVLEEALR